MRAYLVATHLLWSGKDIYERETNNQTDALDHTQIGVMLLAIGIGLNQYLDSLVDPHNDLLEVFFKQH